MAYYVTNTPREVCVLVATGNSLLGDVLESLLANALTLRVQRATFVNSDDMLKAINQYQPEVIVLEEGFIGDSAVRLLSRLPGDGPIRVIVVGLEENLVHVYDKSPVPVTQAADFTRLIENFSTHSP